MLDCPTSSPVQRGRRGTKATEGLKNASTQPLVPSVECSFLYFLLCISLALCPTPSPSSQMFFEESAFCGPQCGRGCLLPRSREVGKIWSRVDTVECQSQKRKSGQKCRMKWEKRSALPYSTCPRSESRCWTRDCNWTSKWTPASWVKRFGSVLFTSLTLCEVDRQFLYLVRYCRGKSRSFARRLVDNVECQSVKRKSGQRRREWVKCGEEE